MFVNKKNYRLVKIFCKYSLFFSSITSPPDAENAAEMKRCFGYQNIIKPLTLGT